MNLVGMEALARCVIWLSALMVQKFHLIHINGGLIWVSCANKAPEIVNADKDILPAAWLFQFYVDRSNTVCIPPDKAGRSSP
jgi:hypothetical protein